jgi:hypothetical protein
MKDSVDRWLVVAVVCAGFLGPLTSRAAEPPGDAPATRSGIEMLPPLTPTSERPPAYVLPPSGWPAVSTGGLDPLLDRPYSAQPGFFTNLETNVLWLHLRNQLAGLVPNPFTGNTDSVRFPGNKLDTAVSPRFEVGYRIPDNWGSLSLGYRFLASRGRDQVTTGPEDAFGGPADQDGRFDYNMVDLTYNSREYSLDPDWNLRWGFGPRMLFLYFDSRVRFLAPASDPGSILAQSESNHLRAYGFWAYLDLERRIGDTGFGLFARVEGTELFARNSQHYTETVAGNPGGEAQLLQARFTNSVSTPILREVIGVSYTVPGWNYTRFQLGYEYETYFHIGRLGGPEVSSPIETRGQLDAQGLFLRAEINF